MEQLLSVKNLVKSYREGGAEYRAVDHLDMEVNAGEFVIIMGASGSGKTSLLHLIAGLDTPDGGTIRYARTTDFERMGERARALFRRKNLGIVFQQQCLIPDLTVYENIMLPVMLRGNRNAAGKEAVLTLCERFGLREHVRKYPSQLSGGQQQRAAILRAVINRPPLLLCDEPTGSLNSAQSEMVMSLLNGLNRNGQTIILVTHDSRVAVRGGRVIYIADGHMEGELKFTDESPVKSREDALARFLRQRGW